VSALALLAWTTRRALSKRPWVVPASAPSTPPQQAPEPVAAPERIPTESNHEAERR
jgi:hypothetical protein